MNSFAVRCEKGLRTWRLIRQARERIEALRADGRRTGGACLVTNLAQMGDVVLSAGVTAALRGRFSDSLLFFAGQPRWLEVLEGDPAVDGLLGAQSLFEVRALARAGLFETVYVLDIPIPTLLHYLDGLPNIYRYAPPTTGDWFTRDEKLMAFYERNAGLPLGSASPRIWVRSEEEAFAAALWDQYHLSSPEGAVIALHTQSSMASKNWPLDHWAALIARRQARDGTRFLILGGPGEATALQTLPGVTHLAGQLSLKQTAAVIRRCDFFAGLDSGLAYIAEAMGTPGLVVLGATVAETSGPRWEGFSFVRAPAACLPACHRACTQQPLCITHLSVDAVDQALDAAWERRHAWRRREVA
jgi:ADP-heptose:LPS heptosyltransferase